MTINVKKYLPNNENLSLTQAEVDKDLKARCKKKMRKHGVSWRDLFEAAMKSYLDEK